MPSDGQLPPYTANRGLLNGMGSGPEAGSMSSGERAAGVSHCARFMRKPLSRQRRPQHIGTCGVFRELRRENLAARLKAAIGEQLGRGNFAGGAALVRDEGATNCSATLSLLRPEG